MAATEEEKSFDEVVEWVRNTPLPSTQAEKLACYGLYKQATEGDNTASHPWVSSPFRQTGSILIMNFSPSFFFPAVRRI